LDGWVHDASVLVDFAEEILTVNQLEAAPPERLKNESLLRKLGIRSLGNDPNQVGFIVPTCIGKALPDAVSSTGTGDYKVLFVEVDQLAVVQVDCELKSKEIT
jgi:hypothetical protein